LENKSMKFVASKRKYGKILESVIKMLEKFQNKNVLQSTRC